MPTFDPFREMDVVAVIPARGGSVGLPKKNIRPMLGIPLVSRTVTTALRAKSITDVYVSSDDDDVLRLARDAGATPIVRPDAISGNDASSESALLHALDWMSGRGRAQPDYLVFLQCTSVFTRPGDIDRVVQTIVDRAAQSALSVVEDHGFIWREGPDGFAAGVTHDEKRPRQRRQDMAPRYRENGAIYAMHVPSFLERKERFCGSVVLVPVDGPALEIDDENDWDIAESLLSRVPGDHDRPAAPDGGRRIKAVVTDFDGVHTDDCVLVDQNGLESVQCNRRDGLGIEMLRERGVLLLILSKEANPVVRARAAKLKMQVLNQIDDKLPVLDTWRREQGLEWSEIAYIGNDINDIDCMRAAGASFAPADAHSQAREAAGRILSSPGGRGAIREMSDILINEKLLAVPDK
ncbi:acylneuraminate cytidylyltransferase [Stappia sp.]|uniref:acylneuraminate cytidylyltransferase n=1 Tax=Stappia sp. TaxID=1870903 RepID=UPI0032D99E47